MSAAKLAAASPQALPAGSSAAAPEDVRHQYARARTDVLFFSWLSGPGQELVRSLVEDVHDGRALNPADFASMSNSPQRLRSSELDSSTTKLSPGKVGEISPAALKRKLPSEQGGDVTLSPSLKRKTRALSQLSVTSMPRFYLPGSLWKREITDPLEPRLDQIRSLFGNYATEGLTLEQFKPVSKALFRHPSTFHAVLFRRIRLLTREWNGEPAPEYHMNPPSASSQPSSRRSSNLNESRRGSFIALNNKPHNPADLVQESMDRELDSGRITLAEFCTWWKREVEPFDASERLFRLLKRPEAQYVRAKDFFAPVRELIMLHPGLKFLENTPEFQEKYARTVVTRIMYRVNTSWTGDVTLHELRKSDLMQYFELADEEEEINQLNEYFSYAHFYVMYCKFWELDSDHDFLLSKEDLIKYGGHALTVTIVDRIFQQPARPFSSGVKSKMGFEDFCFFILSEEDKTTKTSLRYWFSLVDLDGDGVIREWEVREFYSDQLKRMKSYGHEEVKLEDVFFQLRDGLGCNTPELALTLEHFTHPSRRPFSGVFFNLLFNLNKFAQAEARDIFSRETDEEQLTDWDRFAALEYERLAGGEDARQQRSASEDDEEEEDEEEDDAGSSSSDENEPTMPIVGSAETASDSDDEDDDDADEDDGLDPLEPPTRYPMYDDLFREELARHNIPALWSR